MTNYKPMELHWLKGYRNFLVPFTRGSAGVALIEIFAPNKSVWRPMWRLELKTPRQHFDAS